jgi:hypothetical protein
MSELRDIAYRVDPVPWVREVLKFEPTPWQETFLRAPRGASLLALTARQVGKTTTAAWAIAYTMVFRPNSLSVIACPAQRQSAEAIRRVKEALVMAGAEFTSEHVYGLELKSGARALALPGSDDSIRGMTVDGWIVADEAARLTHDLIAALRPMRARRPEARFAMLSTGLEPHGSILDGVVGTAIRIGFGSRRPRRPRRSPRGHQGGDRQGVERDLAALPRPLHAKRACG